MTEDVDQFAELRAWIDAAMEGRLSQDDADRMQRLVIENSEARRYYIRCVHQERDLHTIGAAETAPEPGAVAPAPAWTLPEPSASPRSWRWAAALLLGLAAAFAFLMPPRETVSARLTRSVGAEWETAGTVLRLDGAMPEGVVKLRRGLGELTFERGAKVVLEAPARFEILGPNRMILHEGRLSADVPERAKGFTVQTPRGDVVDFGTRFGVSVEPSAARADVHVFEGEVHVHPDGGMRRSVTDRQALRLEADAAAPKDLAADPQRFLRSLETGASLGGLLISDRFDYASGDLMKQAGGFSRDAANRWTGAWRLETRSIGERFVAEGSAVRIGGEIDVWSSAFRDFTLATEPGTTLYFSIRLRAHRLPKPNSRGNLSFNDAQINIGAEQDQFRLKLGEGHDARFGRVEPGRWYRLVGRAEFEVDGRNDRLSMWVDPRREADTPGAVLGGWNVGRDLGDDLCFHAARDAVFDVADLRIGTTFQSVNPQE